MFQSEIPQIYFVGFSCICYDDFIANHQVSKSVDKYGTLLYIRGREVVMMSENNQIGDFITNDINMNEIETNEIITNLIKTNDIKTNEIITNDIKTNEIITNDIKTNDIKTNDIETNDIETNPIVISNPMVNESSFAFQAKSSSSSALESNGLQTKDYWYDLPEHLIAQHPSEKRDMSKLIVVDRKTESLSHHVFHDLFDRIESGDCLVINNTRVIPARMIGQRDSGIGKMEFVLLKKLEPDIWEVMVRPGRKAKIGKVISFGGGLLHAEIVEVLDEGNRKVRFLYQGIWEEVLDKIGLIPLPPYITASLEDKERYQTVYSRINGSAAAPTAGLHFTTELLEALRKKGVTIAEVTLHVGLGTFRPVKVDNILEHHMHSESYSISRETCDAVIKTKNNGGRVFAVGTTSVRVLETVAALCEEQGLDSLLIPQDGETRIFIYPGCRFRVTDALITNFHLPESTLMMLVSAFAGKDLIMRAYEEAINHQYRFFSFGDAMLIT
jgi:S-adenosylmethionine:tRNA ribosyltransferase-isomerase